MVEDYVIITSPVGYIVTCVAHADEFRYRVATKCEARELGRAHNADKHKPKAPNPRFYNAEFDLALFGVAVSCSDGDWSGKAKTEADAMKLWKAHAASTHG